MCVDSARHYVYCLLRHRWLFSSCSSFQCILNMTIFLFGTLSLRQQSNSNCIWFRPKSQYLYLCSTYTNSPISSVKCDSRAHYDSSSFVIIVTMYPFHLLIWFVVFAAPAQMSTWNCRFIFIVNEILGKLIYWKQANWSFIFHFTWLHALLYLDL